jgi:hypothetical protein
MIPGLRMPRAETGKGKGVLGGALFGLACIAVALGLQFWNEGRAMRRAQVLDAAGAQVQPLAQAGEGGLAHVSATASASAAVADPDFGVATQGLALRREVEMYQWVEKREKRSERRADGSTREVEEYRYERRWSDEHADSSRFREPAGHENPPPPPFRSQRFRADEVRVEGRVLDPRIAGEIGGWEPLPASTDALPPNLAASLRPADGWLYSGEDFAAPQVGDLRIRFARIPEGQVSLIAAAPAGRLAPATLRSDEAFFLIERGQQSPEALIESARSSNSALAWGLRAGGFALLWMGFGLLLRPLVALAEWVPLLGRLVGGAAAVVSFALAAGFSLLAIGSGWLWYRPWWLFGGVLLLVAAGVLLLRRRPPSPAAAGPPPPPPPPPPG